jgi:hypothetical protein
VAFMCLDLDLLSPFLGANISFVKFTQWSRQVKGGSMNVSDIVYHQRSYMIIVILPGKDISLLCSLETMPEDVDPKFCS